MYHKILLPSSIKVVTHGIKDRDSIAVGIWIDVGGRYENRKNKGVAHFLEHILFKGSQKYSCTAIKELIEGVGGALNAFTSEEQTCYFAKIPTKHLPRTFDILSDMVLNPLITKKDVDKEKGVILEEIKMYHDLPQHLVMDLLDELTWPNHPLGSRLSGTIESVSSLSHEDLYQFHRQHYVPGNVVVAACGNLRHQSLIQLMEKKWKKADPREKINCLPAVNIQSKPQAKFFHKEIEQMHLALGMFCYDNQHKDRFVLYLLNVILGGNMSSRLFNEVREKRSLAYSIGSWTKILADTGMLVVRAGVDNKKVVDAIEVILKELKKIKDNGVTQDELTRAKDYYLGQVLLGLEDTLDHMLWIGESTISRDKIMTLEALVQETKKIRLADIKRVANELIKEQQFNLSIVGPLTAGQEKDINRLLGIR